MRGSLARAGISDSCSREAGVARDDKAAFDLYDQACKAGSVGDCTNLANAFELGQGTPMDLGRARALFAESCAKENAVACASVRRLGSP